MARERLRAGRSIDVVDPDEVPDDALVAAVRFIGPEAFGYAGVEYVPVSGTFGMGNS